MLKRNLIANYLGQGWVALMGLAFIPIYIHQLGMEAFGLIGLFGVLAVWLSLLDMGMTPTLSREMARFTGGGHTPESIRDLLRSIEIIVICLAIFIAAGIFLVSNWLASSWLKAENLPIPVVAQAFAIMGLVTALRFVEGIYRSSIVGLQRQVLFNVVNSIMATLRGLGAIGVLYWISPTIQAFFLWQGLISVATLLILSVTTYACLPSAGRSGRFSMDALRGVWQFAGGMLGITLLALLLTQVDKILLSKMLTLSEYGYYTLAAIVSGALYMLVSPITQTWFPRFVQLHAENNQEGLVRAYHQGAQLVSVIAGSAALVLIVFSEDILRLWTHDVELAKRVAPLLSVLVLGNLLNALMYIPSQMQLALGWTGLAVRINIVSLLIIIPAILWAVPLFGAIGAAWVWVGLNVGYVLIGAPLMYRKILTSEKWRWYLQDVCLPIFAAALSAIIVKWLAPSNLSMIGQFSIIALAAVLTLVAAIIATPQLCKQIQNILLARARLLLPHNF